MMDLKVITLMVNVGLDPAGPGFANSGLNRTCAQFVQILHTDPDDLGIGRAVGDADFYANKNRFVQPGVVIKQLGHLKAIYYYFASLFPENKFIGVECGNNKVYRKNGYKHKIKSRFGGFNDAKVGIFCFNTQSCFPYAIE